MTDRLDQLVPLLACPRCARPLQRRGDALRCRRRHSFPVVRGVPVFTEVGREVEVRPDDHVSHQPPSRLTDLLGAHSPWLHLGAGASSERYQGSVELETAIFKNTDLIGDAAALPFRDGALGGALALNVFEHLEDPERSVAELRRVIRPGGAVVIQTAFLQPLHADPSHYFNVTDRGVRRWFRTFDVDEVSVPENFNPIYALSWLSSDLLLHAGDDDARQRLSSTTLAELADIWRDPSARSGELYDTFRALGDGAQRVLAAGFELRATRPPR